MIPIEHSACNAVLRPAPGTEDHVIPLPIARYRDAQGQINVASFWKPTPQELEMLNANGCVILHCHGSTHPPLWIEGVPTL